MFALPQQVVVSDLPSSFPSPGVLLRQLTQSSLLAVQLVPVKSFISLLGDVNVFQNFGEVPVASQIQSPANEK